MVKKKKINIDVSTPSIEIELSTKKQDINLESSLSSINFEVSPINLDYNKIINKPFIPKKTSELQNDCNFISCKYLEINQEIETFLNTTTLESGFFEVYNNINENTYFLILHNAKNKGKKVQEYFSIDEPWKRYVRKGEYTIETQEIKWDNWYIINGITNN